MKENQEAKEEERVVEKKKEVVEIEIGTRGEAKRGERLTHDPRPKSF